MAIGNMVSANIEMNTTNETLTTAVLLTEKPVKIMKNLMTNTVTVTINPKCEKNILPMVIPRSFPE
jgi:hypothetical protein